MPKRKYSDDSEDDELYQEFKKLKKKMRRSRRKHKRTRSRHSSPARSNIQDRDITPDITPWLGTIDEEVYSRSIERDTRSAEPTTPAPHSPADQPATQPCVVQTPDTLTPVTQTVAAIQVPETVIVGTTDQAQGSEYTPSTSVHAPEPELDSIALEILGEDPTLEVQYGKNIHKDVAVRFEHTAVNGLSKESRKELTSKYLTPANCTLIEPPVLNAEIKAAATIPVVKRDKAIEFKQKQLAAAISCLGEAISRILIAKNKDTELLKILMDAGRILCDCQHTDSSTRRSFMISTLKPDMKAQLQNTKIDNFLFGKDLQETIKSAKVINKSSIELKSSSEPRPQQAPVRRPTQAQPTHNRNLNWRCPLPGRRPAAPRTREPAPPGPSAPASYRPPPPPPPPPPRQQYAYYKTSQNRPATYRR